MTDYNAKYLVPLEAPTDALKYAINRTAREVVDKVLGEIRDKECCTIRMDERQYDEPTMNSVVVHCRIDIDDVVYCKDCEHLDVINTENTYAICHEHDIIFEPFEDDTRTHFCSWGKRKEPLPQYEEWQDEFNKMCESARPKTFVADEWYRDTFGENNGK